MAQHDQVIADGPGLTFRTDINNALAALFSSSSGTTEPTVKQAGQLWFNTTSGRLQVRNSANTAWDAITKYMGGTVTLDSAVVFSGTSTAVGNALIGIQDARTTVGAEGNAVLAINRQNSTTPALMFGNDAASAGLIGSNNASTRIGKWVSGVFTSYLNIGTNGVVTVDGTLNIAEGGQTVIIGTNTTAGIEIQALAPSIKLTDTSTDAHDFWMHVDSNNFYVLVDRDNSGAYEAPYPLQLEGDTNRGYMFGSEIWNAGNQPVDAVAGTANTLAKRDGSGDIHARLFRSEYDATNATIGYFMTQIDTVSNNYIRPSTPAQAAAALSGLVNAGTLDGIDSASFVQTSRTVTAGNGLTGGGALSANIALALGTPGTLTSGTANAVTATSHTHLVDEDSIVSVGMSVLGAGAVGTYALMKSTGGAVDVGATVAASGLRYSTADGGEVSATLPTGTWRCMGYCELITVFLRIS